MEHLVAVFIGISSTVFSAAIIGFAAFSWRNWRARHAPLRDLFSFDRHLQAVCVIPANLPMETTVTSVATEDMLAVNYIERALALINFPEDQFVIRGVHQFAQHNRDEKLNNLILVAGPTKNAVLQEVLEKLAEADVVKCGFRASDGDSDRLELFFGDATIKSPSYDQEDEMRQHRVDVSSATLEDYALVLKARSPWNSKATVLAVAGIRAIGTWGAAKHLRQSASEIRDKVGDHDFALVVKVRYANWKIVSTELAPFLEIIR